MSTNLESSSELFSDEVERLQAMLGTLADDPSVKRLAKIWDDIGIEEEQRISRRKTMMEHLIALLTEMVEEEDNLKEKLLGSIRENLEKLKLLRADLKLKAEPKESHMDGMTVKAKEKRIREKVDKLNQIKHDRMKRFKRLTEMEVALCHSIDEPSKLSTYWQAQCLPSEQDLQEYRDRVDHLSSIKDQRQVEFLNIRVKAQHIWTDLEWNPQEEIGKVLAEGDVGKFVFSLENMARVQQFYKELEGFATSQQKKAIKLRAKVSSLWERLEEPAEERELFLQQHQGYNLPTIQALETEVERLNVLKQKNMSRFIEATRAELSKIWDKCYYGPQQRQEFLLGYTDDCSDDVLSAHESELDRMRGFYSDNADLFKLVEKRETMWKRKLEFDARANDPSRLQNRGGKLLMEQRAQRQLMKQFPKVEEQVKAAATAWEESYGRPFFISDVRYIDTIEDQWNEYKLSKESEKTEKKKVKEETTLQEMKFGSRPITPARKRPATHTPTSSTKNSKLIKVAPSPLIKATSNKTRKITPKTRRAAAKRPRKILADKNYSIRSSRSGTESKEVTLRSAEISLASTGDYFDFKRGFSQGLESNKTARSSTIPKNIL